MKVYGGGTVKDMTNKELPFAGNGLANFDLHLLLSLCISRQGLNFGGIEIDTCSYNDLWLSVEYFSIVA